MFGMHSFQRHFEVAGFSGVIESRRAIGLVTTAAKDEKIGCPSATLRLAEESGDVMRANGAFQPVQKQQPGSVLGSVEAMDIDEVSVRRVPALDSKRKRRSGTKEFSP